MSSTKCFAILTTFSLRIKVFKIIIVFLFQPLDKLKIMSQNVKTKAFSSRRSASWMRLFEWGPRPLLSYHYLDVWCCIRCDAVSPLASICLSRRLQTSSYVVSTTSGRCLRYFRVSEYLCLQNTIDPQNVQLHSPKSAIWLQDTKYAQPNVSHNDAEALLSKIPLETMRI